MRDLENQNESSRIVERERTMTVRLRSFIKAWGSAMLLAALGLVLWEIIVRVLDVQTWISAPSVFDPR